MLDRCNYANIDVLPTTPTITQRWPNDELLYDYLLNFYRVVSIKYMTLNFCQLVFFLNISKNIHNIYALDGYLQSDIVPKFASNHYKHAILRVKYKDELDWIKNFVNHLYLFLLFYINISV